MQSIVFYFVKRAARKICAMMFVHWHMDVLSVSWRAISLSVFLPNIAECFCVSYPVTCVVLATMCVCTYMCQVIVLANVLSRLQQSVFYKWNTTNCIPLVDYNKLYSPCSIQQFVFLFQNTTNCISLVEYNKLYSTCRLQQIVFHLQNITNCIPLVEYNKLYFTCRIQQIVFHLQNTANCIPLVEYNNLYSTCRIQQL